MNHTPSFLGVRSLLLTAAVALTLVVTPRVSAQAQSLLSQNGVVISAVEPLLAADGNGGAIVITGINFPRSVKAPYPVVSLRTPSGPVSTLTSQYDGSAVTALLPAGLSTTTPGSYRVMVSFGPGTNVTDSFEFTIGAVGLTGAKGDKGDKGDQGIQGVQGVQGDKGDQGIQGIQGIQGPKGDKGDQGIQGIQGVQGEKGETGEQGPRGFMGPQGPQGDKGDTGAKGDKGDTGAQGAQGPAGVTGLSVLRIFHNKPAALAAGLKVGDFWVQDTSGQVYRIMDLDPGYGNSGN